MNVLFFDTPILLISCTRTYPVVPIVVQYCLYKGLCGNIIHNIGINCRSPNHDQAVNNLQPVSDELSLFEDSIQLYFSYFISIHLYSLRIVGGHVSITYS